MDTLGFLHGLDWADIPAATQSQVNLSLLDLIGVGLGGATTRANQITRDYVSVQNADHRPMLFDARTASAWGVAHAGTATIAALDGHDGFNPAMGHAGAAAFPTAFAMAHEAGNRNGADLLTTLTLGYEFGWRLATALHATTPDYHTSGAWMAVACAGLGARYLRLDPDITRHAMGIAEDHRPRSQMMRCNQHEEAEHVGGEAPQMAGGAAAFLAQAGFTGAPALTLEQAPDHWADLGTRWLVNQQYYKPYPACRWAQAPIEGVLHLRRAHGVTAQDVDRIEVETFHESVRLATAQPTSTDAAQYSTSFPCAVAMVKGNVTPADIADDALTDPEVLRLSRGMVMAEHVTANAVFPITRLTRTHLILRDGTVLQGDWIEPKWDTTCPPSEADLRAKFRNLAGAQATAIEDAVDALPTTGVGRLSALLAQPISP